MKIFKVFGSELNYEEIIQIDGAFSVTHINYNESPLFNGKSSKDIARLSRKNSLSKEDKIENVLDYLYDFDGTEKDYKLNDRIELWKIFWLEYINAFDKLVEIIPKSIVTINVGRQAIEIGLKYLLLKKTGRVEKTHELHTLCNQLFLECEINEDYMNDVKKFFELYCKYIEGGNDEYFRYPEYKSNKYFAGNRLDVEWLSYNFSLILLKLVHYADLDNEFNEEIKVEYIL